MKRRKREKNTKSQKLQKKNIGTKLITNNKKLKLKIQSRVWNFKNTMLKERRRRKKKEGEKEKKKKQGHKNYKKNIYEVCFKKNRVLSFFCKVIGYKSGN